MKNILKGLLFGKNNKLSGLIALTVIGSIALGCNCGKDTDLANLTRESNTNSTVTTPSETTTDGSIPSNEVVEALVKETIAEFAEAVEDNDFSGLYQNASQDFQSTYTLEQVTAAFKSYTDKKSIVSPIFNKVAASDAEFFTPVGIRDEKGAKILMAKGVFETKPYSTGFDFEYVLRLGGEWKLLKLIINVPSTFPSTKGT